MVSVSVKRVGRGSYLKALETDWLRHLGFSDKELEGGEIDLVFKAGRSDRQPIITISRPLGRK